MQTETDGGHTYVNINIAYSTNIYQMIIQPADSTTGIFVNCQPQHGAYGAINPADILSKHWGYTQVKTMLKAILFWEGDTGDIEEE